MATSPGAAAVVVSGGRPYRDADVQTLIQLWNRTHRAFGGHVPRSAEYWRWCILERPGVTADDVIIIDGPSGPLAYGVLAPGGTVIELAIDPELVGAERERVADTLVVALEARCRTRGDESITLELPRADGPLNRYLTGRSYRQEPTSSLSLMMLDAPKLLEAVLRQRQPRFPHGWAPVFVIELAPGHYRFHPDHLLKLVVEPEVEVTVIDESEAERVHERLELESRARAAAQTARDDGFDRSDEPEPPCRIAIDLSTLSDIVFGRDTFEAALADQRVTVEPAAGEQDARTLFSFLAVKSPWYTPNADGR